MQPHESGALFGHAQRVRFSIPFKPCTAQMHSAESAGSPFSLSEYHLYWRHLVNCIAMRVAIVSAIMNGSSLPRMCQYKHTRFRLECYLVLNVVFGWPCHLFLCRFAASSQTRIPVLRG